MPDKKAAITTKLKKNKKGKSKKDFSREPLKITPVNKCNICIDSKCCSYITQYIDTPRTKREFDFLLWQISHPHVQAYKDKSGWFLIIVNDACSHLLPEVLLMMSRRYRWPYAQTACLTAAFNGILLASAAPVNASDPVTVVPIKRVIMANNKTFIIYSICNCSNLNIRFVNRLFEL